MKEQKKEFDKKFYKNRGFWACVASGIAGVLSRDWGCNRKRYRIHFRRLDGARKMGKGILGGDALQAPRSDEM